MKKAWMMYAVSAVLLALLCVALVRVLGLAGAGGALALLGKGDAEFSRAREEVLMSPGDPGPSLLKFAADRSRSRRARVQALQILADAAEHGQTRYGMTELVALLADSSDAIGAEVLKVLQAYQDPACLGAVADILRETRDSTMMQRSLHTLKGCAEPLRRRLNAAVAVDDSAAVDSCLQAAAPFPAGCTKLTLRAAQWYRSRGDTLRAATLTKQLGLVTRFWAIGPFPMNRTREYCREFGPETQPFDSTAQFTAADGEARRWFRMIGSPSEGMMRLDGVMLDLPKSVGYFMTYLNADEELDAFLFVGSCEGIRVWLNGSEIHTHKRLNVPIVDNSVVRVALRPGPNELLIRIDRYLGGWNMSCRVTGTDGNALPGVVPSLAHGSG
ncbi:MAG: hypothetical protein GF331_23665 [Chitinivibrionales bacterium]|nr:hypothetical protein [Chitinivibrionales bacterium]